MTATRFCGSLALMAAFGVLFGSAIGDPVLSGAGVRLFLASAPAWVTCIFLGLFSGAISGLAGLFQFGSGKPLIRQTEPPPLPPSRSRNVAY